MGLKMNKDRQTLVNNFNRTGDSTFFLLCYQTTPENTKYNGHVFYNNLFFHDLHFMIENKNSDCEETKNIKKEFHAIIGELINNPDPKKALYIGRQQCTCCGTDVPFLFDGEYYIADGDCKDPIGPYSYELAVPSGELICANNLREPFPDVDYYVNHHIGIKNTVRDYAKFGMYHPFVGNSCPSVVKRKNGTIEIGDFRGTNSICTDLWWASISDREMLKINCKRKNIDYEEFIKNKNHFVISVKPGLYRCTTTSGYGFKSSLYGKMEFISSEIPEQFFDINKQIFKESIKDPYQHYLNSDYFETFRTFPHYVASIVSRDNNGGDWITFNKDTDEYLSNLYKKYPEIDSYQPNQKLLNSKLLEQDFSKNIFQLPLYNPNVNTLRYNTHDLTNSLSYEQNYSFWAAAFMFFNTLLKCNLITIESDRKIIERNLKICSINLEERGLVDNAIAWINSVDMEIFKNGHPKLIMSKMALIDAFKTEYLRRNTEEDFDKIKNILLESFFSNND
jgi:hypothetical protein